MRARSRIGRIQWASDVLIVRPGTAGFTGCDQPAPTKYSISLAPHNSLNKVHITQENVTVIPESELPVPNDAWMLMADIYFVIQPPPELPERLSLRIVSITSAVLFLDNFHRRIVYLGPFLGLIELQKATTLLHSSPNPTATGSCCDMLSWGSINAFLSSHYWLLHAVA